MSLIRFTNLVALTLAGVVLKGQVAHVGEVVDRRRVGVDEAAVVAAEEHVGPGGDRELADPRPEAVAREEVGTRALEAELRRRRRIASSKLSPGPSKVTPQLPFTPFSNPGSLIKSRSMPPAGPALKWMPSRWPCSMRIAKRGCC